MGRISFRSIALGVICLALAGASQAQASPSPGRWTVEAAVDRAVASAARKVPGGKRLSRAEVACLAKNIYFEARGESDEGRAGVAHVTLNRHADPDFEESVCKVVTSSKQFSWTSTHGKRPMRAVISDREAFEEAAALAVGAMLGLVKDPTEGATFFWSTCERRHAPHWTRGMVVTAKIGCHQFLAGRRNSTPAIEAASFDRLPRGFPEIGRFVYAETEDDELEDVLSGIAAENVVMQLSVAEERIPDGLRASVEVPPSSNPLRVALSGIVAMLWLSVALTTRKPIRIRDRVTKEPGVSAEALSA